MFITSKLEGGNKMAEEDVEEDSMEEGEGVDQMRGVWREGATFCGSQRSSLKESSFFIKKWLTNQKYLFYFKKRYY